MGKEAHIRIKLSKRKYISEHTKAEMYLWCKSELGVSGGWFDLANNEQRRLWPERLTRRLKAGMLYGG